METQLMDLKFEVQNLKNDLKESKKENEALQEKNKQLNDDLVEVKKKAQEAKEVQATQATQAKEKYIKERQRKAQAIAIDLDL